MLYSVCERGESEKSSLSASYIRSNIPRKDVRDVDVANFANDFANEIGATSISVGICYDFSDNCLIITFTGLTGVLAIWEAHPTHVLETLRTELENSIDKLTVSKDALTM